MTNGGNLFGLRSALSTFITVGIDRCDGVRDSCAGWRVVQVWWLLGTSRLFPRALVYPSIYLVTNDFLTRYFRPSDRRLPVLQIYVNALRREWGDSLALF